MNEKKAMFFTNIINNVIAVYFDTFFVFYFFKVANYEVLPLAKYYLTVYLFCAIGFYIIRNSMKKNIKVPYFRIGISLEAIYIALIMLLKDKIINYVYIVGIVKGIADGFFYFPKNILETEKVSNNERQEYSGKINTINKISSIIVPVILGLALTYISYVNLGKIFFILFIVLFTISFKIKDNYYIDKKSNIKDYFKIVKTHKNLKYTLLIYLLSGLSYSGVMATIITLANINVFKTNLNLGLVDSICAVLFLLVCILFTKKINEKRFNIVALISGIISFISLVLFAIFKSVPFLIIYLFIRNSSIGLLSLITSHVITNISNDKKIKDEFKPEYFLVRDVFLTISRCTGYLLLLVISLKFGMDMIYYILILCGISLLLEGIFIYKIYKNS